MMKRLIMGCVLAACLMPLSAEVKLDLMQSQYLTLMSLEAGDAAAQSAIARGDRALKQAPLSITQKEIAPPSGDKCDYVSMSPYWWPDPAKKDGLPYIRKDGEVNPERYQYTDRDQLFQMMNVAYDLGLAYYYSQDDRYAQKLSELIQVFFVDPATKMNPNLQFGQFVPGRGDGRSAGIIETRNLYRIFEGIALVRSSPAWDAQTDAGMKAWAAAYLKWLQNHPLGVQESKSANNHGTHYDAQNLALYLFLGDEAGAKKYIKKYTYKRLQSQIKPDGSQPKELARTKSWDYADMNLVGWVDIAILAEKVGLDLWNYKAKKQVYMRSMFDWYLPYLDGTKAWEWKQIVRMRLDTLRASFAQASRVYGDEKYNQAIEKQSIVK